MTIKVLRKIKKKSLSKKCVILTFMRTLLCTIDSHLSRIFLIRAPYAVPKLGASDQPVLRF